MQNLRPNHKSDRNSRTCRSSRGSLARQLCSQASRRKDISLAAVPGRRTEAGHRSLCRHQGFDKTDRELDPEEAQKIIDPVLQVMMDAVHRYEGTVNQVLGDGIMALFGAPLAHEDHAVRACYAALAMQEEMRRYRENSASPEESGLQIGIGLNSGEVVVRSISNDLNVDYSALGHTTHLAARMQELAAGGTTLMTASTLRQVEGFVQVKSVGAVQVKGVSRAVEAFEARRPTRRAHAYRPRPSRADAISRTAD